MEKKGTPRKSLVTLRIPCSRTKVKKGWNLNMYLNGKQVWNFVGSFCGLHFLASKFSWLKKPTNTLPSGKCFFGIPGIIFTMSSWWWPGKPRERGTNDRINSLTEIHLYKLLVLTCRIFCKITSPVGDKINFTLEKWMAWNPWDFLEDPPSPFEVFFSNFAPENGSGFEDACCFLNQSNYISNFEGYICIYRTAVYC